MSIEEFASSKSLSSQQRYLPEPFGGGDGWEMRIRVRRNLDGPMYYQV